MSNNQIPPDKSTDSPRLEAGTFFKTQQQREHEYADRIIKTLLDAGYSYAEMRPVIRMAKQKFNQLKLKTMKKNKVYIAGKVTGEDYQQCWNKFEIAENILETAGYEVTNPMRIVPHATPWHEAMNLLKPHLLASDIVLLLPDWSESDGAVLENHWALRNNKTVVHYNDTLFADLLQNRICLA